MPNRSVVLALALALGASVALGASPSTQRSQTSNSARRESTVAAYKWVDDKGVTHYGDSIPPEYSQGSSTALNRQGVPITQRAAQMSPAELAEEAERQKLLNRNRQHDSFLLTTYVSVHDIESLRDERLGQIAGQRQAAHQYIDSLQARVFSLQKRAQNFRPYSTNPDARPMPDDLVEDLARSSEEVRRQRDALVLKDREETQVRTQFEADIKRFNELRPPQLQPQR